VCAAGPQVPGAIGPVPNDRACQQVFRTATRVTGIDGFDSGFDRSPIG
jgi:hypothetical protein